MPTVATFCRFERLALRASNSVYAIGIFNTETRDANYNPLASLTGTSPLPHVAIDLIISGYGLVGVASN